MVKKNHKDNSMRNAYKKKKLLKSNFENYQKNTWLSDHCLQLLQYVTILPPMDQSSLLRRKNMRRNKQNGLLTFQSTFAAKDNFKNRSY